MDKLWLKQYEKDVPHDINSDLYASIPVLFNEACNKYRNDIALRNYGSELTYGQWQQYSRDFAAFCQQRLGLVRGDRLAIMMPNVMQYLIVIFGALQAGLTIVNVNPLYTADELSALVNDSEAKAIVVVANFAKTVEEALVRTRLQHVIITELGDLFPWPKRPIFNFIVKRIKKMVPSWNIPNAMQFRRCLSIGHQLELKSVELTGEDIAFLQYTGGTTGIPKAAVLTHRNMLANVEQAYAWIHNLLMPEREVIITALPLYHIFSLTANAFLFLKLGALNVLITNPRDIPSFIKDLKKTPFTAMTGVNTLFNALLHNHHFREIDFSNLKLTLGGGMAVQKNVAERWQEITGNVILQAYGLTETSPAVTINPLHVTTFNGSIGVPLPSTEISIRNPEGQEVPLGESGELCVRGPQVMREYWKKPEETANVLSKDGWLKTGDIARVDEKGFIYIVDRLKDMIIISGFKVYPNEVEDVIVQLDGVVEAGVVGVQNEKGREIVTAFVVKSNPALGQNEIIEHCRKHLTNYKIPKVVHFIKELPKTNVGKVLRRDLRAN